MDSSYLTQQVSTIIGQLHGLFDEIGVPGHERDSRESELFTALSETLHNQLRLVTSEKHEMQDEANRLVKTIKQIEASLDDSQEGYDLTDNLKVTYPLIDCLQVLKERYNIAVKLHRERFEQVRKLVEALESYASHLEPSFLKIKLPPTGPDASISPTFDLSPAYITNLDNEFSRVYEEYSRRLTTVKTTSDEIIKLWAELGTPQAQTDSAIIKYSRDSPEQLGLHQDDVQRLLSRKDKLVSEKQGRERKLKELRVTIEGLWDRLRVEEPERKAFLASNRGCALRSINEYESELARLNELKRQNLHLFVEDCRFKLQELWDTMYFSEEEMLEFTPAFSDVYSDALLSAHEAEISRLEALKEQRAPTLALIDKHRSLIKDRSDLAASSQDASRLIQKKGERRDPTRLLREEKMRKRITKELPKLEIELRKVLERWEDEYGRPFLVHGDRYLDEMETSSARAPPPRSKTPSVPASAPKPAKSAPASQRGGTVRAPPPRSKTPTSTLSRNNTFSSSVMASSVSTAASNRSPSRLPRAPLSNYPQGNNSPERRQRPNPDDGNLTAKKMPPPRAPPPRMKDLFVPPTPEPVPRDFSDPGSAIVRHVPPEDVYDDRMRAGQGSRLEQYHHHPQYSAPNFSASTMGRSTYASLSSTASASTSASGHPRYQYNNAYYAASSTAAGSRPESRQISQTSSTATGATTVSGSENWETYESEADGDVEEPDATDAYYAKLRQGKRMTPEGGTSPRAMGKRAKGVGLGVRGAVVVEGVEGSEGGWTDEDAF